MQADGTLQAQDKVIRESDLVMLLISDAAQANDYKKKIGAYCDGLFPWQQLTWDRCRAAAQEGRHPRSLPRLPPRPPGQLYLYASISSLVL